MLSKMLKKLSRFLYQLCEPLTISGDTAKHFEKSFNVWNENNTSLKRVKVIKQNNFIVRLYIQPYFVPLFNLNVITVTFNMSYGL